MSSAKVAVTIDPSLLGELDRRVADGEFRSRSHAVQTAVALLLETGRRDQLLLAELAKLDAEEERALADEGLQAEGSWPRY